MKAKARARGSDIRRCSGVRSASSPLVLDTLKVAQVDFDMGKARLEGRDEQPEKLRAEREANAIIMKKLAGWERQIAAVQCTRDQIVHTIVHEELFFWSSA